MCFQKHMYSSRNSVSKAKVSKTSLIYANFVNNQTMNKLINYQHNFEPHNFFWALFVTALLHNCEDLFLCYNIFMELN